MPFTAIQYVTSGLTLVAFLAAVGFAIYRRRLRSRENLIQSAPEAERARLVQSTLEFFNVDTGRLTKQQAYDLALSQIQARSQRYFVNAIVLVVFGVLAVVALWVTGGQAPVTETSEPKPAALFRSEEADIFLPKWKPTPEKEPDGAMGIQGKDLTLWQGPLVDKVRTLAFWIELNKGEQSIAWAAVKHPVWYKSISRFLSKNSPNVLHMPSVGANSGIYRLETPDVELNTSTFEFDRPIKDEILTVLVQTEPMKTFCKLSYTFAFDAPPTAETEAEEAIQNDLLKRDKTYNGCVTLEGTAKPEMCSEPLQIGFSNPTDTTKLRVLKVTVNEKDPIGHRCSAGQQ